MALKAVLTDLSTVPDSLRPEYEARDGAFYLKIEGTPYGFVSRTELEAANAKTAEFRDENIKARRERDQLTEKLKALDGIDPEKYKTTLKQLEELQAAPPKGDEETGKKIAQAVAPLQATLAEVRAALKAQQDAAQQAQLALSRKELEGALTTAGLKVGVDEKALPDYIRRGMDIFKVVDGKIVAMDGEKPLFSKPNPGDPLTVEEWASTLPADAPHLFKPSRGGGANPPQGGGQSGSPRNPNARIIHNPTPQELGRLSEQIFKGEVVIAPTDH